jgi:hypothetical protein
MADFNSKYSGEQVEQLLDMVAGGNAGGGGGGGITVETDPIFSASPASRLTDADLGNIALLPDINGDIAQLYDDIANIPIYLADFTVENLEAAMEEQTVLQCNMQALIEAMRANKLILVKRWSYEGAEGVCALNGFEEGEIYFSLITEEGKVLTCNGTGNLGIDGTTLSYVKDVYITDFTVDMLRRATPNDYIIINRSGLENAIHYNKIILVPNGSAVGYCQMNAALGDGDSLKFSILTATGDIVSHNGDISTQGELFTTNISVINLVSGYTPIFIAGGTPTITIDRSKSTAKYICYDPVTSLTVEEESQMPRAHTEIHISFKTASEVGVFDFPASWLWANGEAIPIEPNTLYELSVVCTDIEGDLYWKATLISFK